MNMVKKKGNLIYVPSEVVMINRDDGHDKYSKKLKEPKVLLVLNERDATYEVLYEGKTWVIPKSKTYSVQQEREIENDC